MTDPTFDPRDLLRRWEAILAMGFPMPATARDWFAPVLRRLIAVEEELRRVRETEKR